MEDDLKTKETDKETIKIVMASIRQSISDKSPPSAADLSTIKRLADKYLNDPEIQKLLRLAEELFTKAQEVAEQEIAAQEILTQEMREFEENLKIDPIGTAKKYFSTPEMMESLAISERLTKGLPVSNEELARHAQRLAHPTHLHHRASISEALGEKIEELNLRLNEEIDAKTRKELEKELREAKEALHKNATSEIDHQILEKHRKHHFRITGVNLSHSELLKHKGDLIRKEIKETKELISRTIEGGLSTIGTLKRNVIKQFVDDKNIEKLKQGIEHTNIQNKAKAVALESTKTAVKDGVKDNKNVGTKGQEVVVDGKITSNKLDAEKRKRATPKLIEDISSHSPFSPKETPSVNAGKARGAKYFS